MQTELKFSRDETHTKQNTTNKSICCQSNDIEAILCFFEFWAPQGEKIIVLISIRPKVSWNDRILLPLTGKISSLSSSIHWQHMMREELVRKLRNCLSCVLTARILLLSNLSNAVQYMMFHIFLFIYSSFTGISRTHNITSSQLAW